MRSRCILVLKATSLLLHAYHGRAAASGILAVEKKHRWNREDEENSAESEEVVVRFTAVPTIEFTAGFASVRAAAASACLARAKIEVDSVRLQEDRWLSIDSPVGRLALDDTPLDSGNRDLIVRAAERTIFGDG